MSAAPLPDPESGPPTIRLRGLEKRFGRRPALAGIDLDVEGAELVGVVGPDGAGKTTLLRSIVGLLEVRAERAEVLGFDLLGDVTELKARVGYVPQSFGLQRELTIDENLAFTARVHRLAAPAWRERAAELLARVGLERFGGRQAGALSGGMKQKLAIVNALLPEPELLVLDEPTAGVDILARGEIWEILVSLRGRALVMLSSSYLDEAAGCDRLVYLDDGRVVASGTPDELRSAVSIELYRAWTEDARAATAAVRRLAYVDGARAVGRYVRVEVDPVRSPGRRRVLAELAAAEGVRLAESVPVDMEAALLGLAGRAAGGARSPRSQPGSTGGAAAGDAAAGARAGGQGAPR